MKTCDELDLMSGGIGSSGFRVASGVPPIFPLNDSIDKNLDLAPASGWFTVGDLQILAKDMGEFWAEVEGVGFPDLTSKLDFNRVHDLFSRIFSPIFLSWKGKKKSY